jgi:hypothetical protein
MMAFVFVASVQAEEPFEGRARMRHFLKPYHTPLTVSSYFCGLPGGADYSNLKQRKRFSPSTSKR